jgi:signal transduction histidine kinase
MRAARIALWVMAALILGAVAAAVVAEIAGSYLPGGVGSAVVATAVTLVTGATGFVLAAKRPRNPIGWLLLGQGLVLAVDVVAECYAAYAVEHDAAGANLAVLYVDGDWPLLFAGLTAIAFVFPDGRLPSARWRPVAVGAAAAFVIMLVAATLTAEPFSAPYGAVDGPLPQLSDASAAVLEWSSALVMLAALASAALAVASRWRRAKGAARQQLKWLALAALTIPVTVVVSGLEILVTGEDGALTLASLVLMLVAVPLAIAVAVLRYRLYDVDRLFNRTLVYVLLSLALGVTYAAVSLGVGVAVGSGSTAATAAATLAVAVAFGPLRRRVQVQVDRRFDRARYAGLQRVERFVADIHAGRAAPEAVGGVLAEALDDPALGLFYWLPSSGVHVDAGGRTVDPLPDEGRACTPVRRGDLSLATIVHDPALRERRDLLESVVRAANLAIEVARLRAEVRRRLAEVEDSRARIVAAADAERRRLERDLHDGAQQRLVSIGLALRHVQARLPAATAEVADLDAAVAEVARAIEELRELARGVRPAALDDGLGSALRELASRSPLRTQVVACDERFADGVETAAYFVASEALANAVKHARASAVTIRAAREDGRLVLSVTDDGVGGTRPGTGSGLLGMHDRVAALNGRLRVDDAPSGGTTVVAELPCGS